MSTAHRQPPGYPESVGPRWESEGYAAVRDTETQLPGGEGLRYVFIRLVPRVQEQGAVHSFTAEATVDLDAEGRMLGVTIAWPTGRSDATGE